MVRHAWAFKLRCHGRAREREGACSRRRERPLGSLSRARARERESACSRRRERSLGSLSRARAQERGHLFASAREVAWLVVMGASTRERPLVSVSARGRLARCHVRARERERAFDRSQELFHFARVIPLSGRAQIMCVHVD